MLQNQLGQSHCFAYSYSIVHQVDVLCIESFGASIQCLYLYPASSDNVHGFYTWNVSDGQICRILNMPSGTLKVLSHGSCNVMSCINVYNGLDSHTARIDFENEIKARKNYGISYTHSLHNIIDELTADKSKIESAQCIMDCSDSNIVNECQELDEDVANRHNSYFPNSLTAHVDCNDDDDSRVYCDAAISDKTVGFLNHSVPQFAFTGPDRHPVEITNVDQCFHIAEIIASTGCPNYAEARIPLASGLNIEEWEKELVDYPDKMLIEYLKFSFPLSLSDLDSLHNTDITNHHSALQYPMAVNNILRKEMALGAIVGPTSNTCSETYHCSPLLSRPKDNDKRRIILNLSHPYGYPVNENVLIFFSILFLLSSKSYTYQYIKVTNEHV